MSKVKALRGATVEDLLAASKKESRATAVRRWMFNNPIPVAVTGLMVALWLFLAIDVPPLVALALVAGAIAVFALWPLVTFVWRLRVEITAALVLAGLFWLLPIAVAATVFAVVIIAGVAVPHARRFSEAQMWCVVTRHRLRGVLERSCGKKAGRVPWLLWTGAIPVGERVRLWLPSGLAFKDIESQLAQIATACWAKEARITKSHRWSHIVTVDVVRRDHLAQPIESDVVTNFADSLDEQTLNNADEYVNEFLTTIEEKEITAPPSDVVTENAVPKQRKQEKSTVSAAADDPF